MYVYVRLVPRGTHGQFQVWGLKQAAEVTADDFALEMQYSGRTNQYRLRADILSAYISEQADSRHMAPISGIKFWNWRVIVPSIIFRSSWRMQRELLRLENLRLRSWHHVGSPFQVWSLVWHSVFY